MTKESIIEGISVIKKSAIFLLMVMVNFLLITTLLYFFKIAITPFHLPIIYLLSITLFCFFYKKENWKHSIISVIMGTVIFVGCILVMGRVYDITVDGNTYHKLAIGSLKNGWNPAYEHNRDFAMKDGNDFDITEDNINALWTDHYAKGTELFAAVIYAFTGNIETGKIYTILLMYITFGIFLEGFYEKRKMKLLTSILIAGLIVFNPINMVQLFNYYVDGALMMSLFLIFYACIIIAEGKHKDGKKEVFFILASAVLLCINIKFTGLAFAGLFCFVFYIYWLYRSYKEGKEVFIKDLKTYTIFYIVTVLISVGIVGYSSYTKNMIDHGHPLYPLQGEGHVANMVLLEQPASFADKNHIEIFLYSLFAKGENVSESYSIEKVKPKLKIPFTITEEEVENYVVPDLRMGGFGPLFSGIFIISAIAVVLALAKLIRNKKWETLVSHLLILGVATILLIVLDGNYWARYVPYIYVIPIMALVYLLEDYKCKWKLGIGIVIAGLLFINSALILKVNYDNCKLNNIYIKRVLRDFEGYSQTNPNVEIQLNHSGLQGALYNLHDLGITNYTVNNQVKKIQEGYFFKY